MESSVKVDNINNTNQERKSIKARQFLIRIIRLVISIILIYWILHTTKVNDITEAMKSANLGLLIIAYFLKYLGYLFSTLRWRVLLRAQGIQVSMFYLLKSYMIGIFFNNLLPSTIGGDAVRAYDSWRAGKNKGVAIAVIFIDRFLGLFALLIFALVGAFLFTKKTAYDFPLINYFLIFASVSMVFIIWLIFMPQKERLSKIGSLSSHIPEKIYKYIDKLINSFLAFQGKGDVLVKALGLSIILQTNVVLHYFLIAEALNFKIPLYNFFLIIPFAIFVMMIPISINAIGIRENIFVFLFGIFGVVQAKSVALAWIAYGITILQGVMGGFVYAFRKK